MGWSGTVYQRLCQVVVVGGDSLPVSVSGGGGGVEWDSLPASVSGGGGGVV